MENLKLNDDSSASLRKAAGWARFLAIVGFVALGLAFINEIFAATMMGVFRNSLYAAGMPVEFGETFTWISLGVVLALTAVCMLPMIYLYCFANKVRRAIDDGDTLTLAQSFASLKRFFLFYGIVVIVWLVFIMLLLIPVAMMIGSMI